MDDQSLPIDTQPAAFKGGLPQGRAEDTPFDICHLLISRIDALGDVVLTLPLLGLLKHYSPNLKISFLGRLYSKAIIDSCVHVDAFIDWDELKNKPQEAKALLRDLKIDAVLHVFPNQAVASLCHGAGIKYRLGTSHRWYHWLWCNQRVSISRAQSPWHEAQLNVLLAMELGLLPGLEQVPSTQALTEFYGLEVSSYWPPELTTQESVSINANGLKTRNVKHVVLHPGSRGSARDWPLPYFVKLAQLLIAGGKTVYLTGTQLEGDVFREDFRELFSQGLVDLTGQLSLAQLFGFLSGCDALVASSTGPLHMAAALGIKAIGIYPPARPMHAGRWGPVGRQAMALSYEPKASCLTCQQGLGCVCVAMIGPQTVGRMLLEDIQYRQCG